MAKDTNYKFTIKDFCKYVLKCWPIIVICALLGGAAAVYSYKHQSTNFSSSATIMVYESDYEYTGSISPYAQISSILTSKEAYKAAGITVKEGSLDSVAIVEKTTGIFNLSDSSADETKAKENLEFVIANAEKVIAKAYDDEKQYHVKVLNVAGEPAADSTKKDKLFSSGLIFAASLVVAIIIDFIAFNKKAA